MLVLHCSEPDPCIHVAPTRGGRIGQRLRQTLSDRITSRQITPTNTGMHSLNAFDSGLADWINRSDFDLVNLHWLGNELISIEEIARIQKPIFWTMHDMWPFCGTEHIDDLDHPGRYITGYGPGTRPTHYNGPDLDAWMWKRKKRAWSKKKLHLISPSHWLAQCSSASDLLQHQSCSVIPNCVDTDIFKPIDRRLARHILNLNPDKNYVLFGAVSSTGDKNKGFHLLQSAIQKLANYDNIKHNTELLIFGAHPPENPPDLSLPTNYLGNFSDEFSLALLYSAADVFAAPSLQENLPNTIIESICCGTACVAFSIGGVPELIKQGYTGTLIEPFEVEFFSSALYQHLAAPIDRNIIRQTALKYYHLTAVAQSYLLEYSKIIF